MRGISRVVSFVSVVGSTVVAWCVRGVGLARGKDPAALAGAVGWGRRRSQLTLPLSIYPDTLNLPRVATWVRGFCDNKSTVRRMHFMSPLIPVLSLPSSFRYWDVVQRHKVTQFYTAPTAIRALMSFGPEIIAGYDLSSLRVLGSVGEPINPEAWRWYNEHVRPGVRWAGSNWGLPFGCHDGPALRHSRPC